MGLTEAASCFSLLFIVYTFFSRLFCNGMEKNKKLINLLLKKIPQ